MKELLKKFENLWVSIAFAEAGEYETSMQLLEQEVSDEGSVKICQTA